MENSLQAATAPVRNKTHLGAFPIWERARGTTMPCRSCWKTLAEKNGKKEKQGLRKDATNIIFKKKVDQGGQCNHFKNFGWGTMCWTWWLFYCVAGGWRDWDSSNDTSRYGYWLWTWTNKSPCMMSPASPPPPLYALSVWQASVFFPL